MAQYCIINGMAVSVANQFNGYTFMAQGDQFYQHQQPQQQQQQQQLYHMNMNNIDFYPQQPLPAAPPPHINGDAYYTPYESNGIPTPFQLKVEPEEIIDDEEQLSEPIESNSTLVQPQQPMYEEKFQLLQADLKKKLSNSGFTQLAKDDPILKPFKCPICDKAFGRLSHVRRHQLLHTGEKPFECEICHEKFTRVENRTRHMSIHTGERRHNCHICGKGFSQLNRLNVHIRIHSGERPFVCEICGKAFGRIDHKNSHMRTHNWVRDKNGLDLKPIVNPFPMKSESVANNVQFKPEHCDSRKTSLDLKTIVNRLPTKLDGVVTSIQIKRELIATPSPELSADNYSDVMSAMLSGGSMIDQKIEKPFKCPTCDKQFSRKDHLNRHIFIHSGTKPFQCEICTKMFSRKDNKYKHMASCIYMNYGIIILKKPPSGTKIFNSDESKSLETKINEKLLEIQNGTLLPIPRGQQKFNEQKLFAAKEHNGKMFASEYDQKPMLYEQIVQYQNENEMSSDYAYNEEDSMSAAATDSGTMPESKDGAVEIMMINPDIQPATNSDDDYDDPEDDELGDDDDEEDNCGDIAAPECQLTVIETGESLDEYGSHPLVNTVTKDESDLYDLIEGEKGEQPIGDALHWRRQFECKVCGKWFVYKSHLVRHMLVHTGEKAFSCDQCDKRFYRKEHLQRHVIVHTGIKPFKCDFCDKTFVDQRAQIRHTMQLHVQTELHADKVDPKRQPDYAPSSTAASFASGATKWDLLKPVIEMKLSSDGQQMQPTAVFKCDQCGKAYGRKSHLKQHYSTHTGEKPFKCDICDQGFSRMEHKKRHMAIHMNIKRYECEFCDRKFSRPDHMLEHLKRHEGVLPYKCNRCGIRFGTSKEKIEHLRTHVDAYRCEFCAERFESYRDLSEHRRIVHRSVMVKGETVNGGVATAAAAAAVAEILVSKKQEFPCPICHQLFDVVTLGDHLKTHVQNYDNIDVSLPSDEDESVGNVAMDNADRSDGLGRRNADVKIEINSDAEESDEMDAES